MFDGAKLEEMRGDARQAFDRAFVDPSHDPAQPSRSAQLGSWWVAGVRNALGPTLLAEEGVTFERLASAVRANSDRLDALEDELLTASRHIYAPS